MDLSEVNRTGTAVVNEPNERVCLTSINGALENQIDQLHETCSEINKKMDEIDAKTSPQNVSGEIAEEAKPPSLLWRIANNVENIHNISNKLTGINARLNQIV